MNSEDDYDETDSCHFHDMVRAAFEHEVECFGIADGLRRRPVDAAYAHEPAYLAGYRKGLALPAEPDDGDL